MSDHAFRDLRSFLVGDDELVVVDNPGGLGFEVTELWAFLAIHEDGDEGVVAMTMGGTLMPLIAADGRRLEQLRPMAEKMARVTGQKIVLAHFHERTNLEVFEP